MGFYLRYLGSPCDQNNVDSSMRLSTALTAIYVRDLNHAWNVSIWAKYIAQICARMDTFCMRSFLFVLSVRIRLPPTGAPLLMTLLHTAVQVVWDLPSKNTNSFIKGYQYYLCIPLYNQHYLLVCIMFYNVFPALCKLKKAMFILFTKIMILMIIGVCLKLVLLILHVM